MTALEKKLWADDIDFITKLTKENKELQAKIDKAIEYIYGYCVEFGELVHYGDSIDPCELVEILKS